MIMKVQLNIDSDNPENMREKANYPIFWQLSNRLIIKGRVKKKSRVSTRGDFH